MAHNFQGNFTPMFRPSVLQVDQQQPQQQTLSSMPSTSIPWTMPWAPKRLPTDPSNIMQFKAPEDHHKVVLHSKRKSDMPQTQPPAKQFISEEKFSAHFNGLHISNNYTQNAAGSMSLEDALMDAAGNANCYEYRVTAKELEEKLRNANKITICEDILKLQEEQKKNLLSPSLLPEALINRIEKPCTALVLWQPPPIIELLHRKNEEELEKAKNKNKDLNNRTSPEDLINDIEFFDAEEIDDFIDNNNTCNVDYNDTAQMDEDL